MRAAYYLRISTEAQELDNQRGEIMPFIERRGWKLVQCLLIVFNIIGSAV
jgi:DNA invertase Pin-like site-specific DNA recombinase